MLSVFASSIDRDDPLSGLNIGERDEPETPNGWVLVEVKAASLNHHDLWSLRGVGLAEDRLPMILGCDAAGLDADGNEVIVHSVITSEGWSGDETFDPKRSILSERHQGTFAQRVAVPARNLVAKPAALSFEEVACLPGVFGDGRIRTYTIGPLPRTYVRLVNTPPRHVSPALPGIVQVDPFAHGPVIAMSLCGRGSQSAGFGKRSTGRAAPSVST